MGAKKPLIVTDKGVAAAGLVDIVVNALKEGVTIGGIADNVPPDSDLKVSQLSWLVFTGITPATQLSPLVAVPSWIRPKGSISLFPKMPPT